MSKSSQLSRVYVWPCNRLHLVQELTCVSQSTLSQAASAQCPAASCASQSHKSGLPPTCGAFVGIFFGDRGSPRVSGRLHVPRDNSSPSPAVSLAALHSLSHPGPKRPSPFGQSHPVVHSPVLPIVITGRTLTRVLWLRFEQRDAKMLATPPGTRNESLERRSRRTSTPSRAMQHCHKEG